MTDASNLWTLFFDDVALGAIANVTLDEPWVCGDLTLFDSASPFHTFFDACTNDEEGPPDPGGEFHDEYFDHERWYVVGRDGSRQNIWLPAVHRRTNSIAWRWR